MEILILESGEIPKLKVMEYIPGKMVTDMKGNGNAVWNMAKGLTYFVMGMYILENIKMGNLKVKVNILGEMVRYM